MNEWGSLLLAFWLGAAVAYLACILVEMLRHEEKQERHAHEWAEWPGGHEERRDKE